MRGLFGGVILFVWLLGCEWIVMVLGEVINGFLFFDIKVKLWLWIVKVRLKEDVCVCVCICICARF